MGIPTLVKQLVTAGGLFRVGPWQLQEPGDGRIQWGWWGSKILLGTILLGNPEMFHDDIDRWWGFPKRMVYWWYWSSKILMRIRGLLMIHWSLIFMGWFECYCFVIFMVDEKLLKEPTFSDWCPKRLTPLINQRTWNILEPMRLNGLATPLPPRTWVDPWPTMPYVNSYGISPRSK